MILYGINFCECWCGKEAKEGNRFIQYHASAIKRNCLEETKQKISESLRNKKYLTKVSQLCLCNCGILTKPGNKYIHGHNGKKEKIPCTKLCACGCSNFVSSDKRKYISGHNNLGFKHSKESVEKQASKLRGIPRSEEDKLKISIGCKGKNLGELNPMYGKHFSLEKNLNWQRGITPKPLAIRNSIEYATWRILIYNRDGYKCHRCNNGSKLIAHHIINFAKLVREESELLFDISNGITFCKDCHKQFHSKYGNRNNNPQQIFEFVYLNGVEY